MVVETSRFKFLVANPGTNQGPRSSNSKGSACINVSLSYRLKTRVRTSRFVSKAAAVCVYAPLIAC